jgi:PleD family two-component response regulator
MRSSQLAPLVLLIDRDAPRAAEVRRALSSAGFQVIVHGQVSAAWRAMQEDALLPSIVVFAPPCASVEHVAFRQILLRSPDTSGIPMLAMCEADETDVGRLEPIVLVRRRYGPNSVLSAVSRILGAGAASRAS